MARAVPLLVVAFAVGSLFRLYNEFGIGFFRMFGTLGIAVMGMMASRLLTSWQLEAAVKELQRQLAALPEGWRVKAVRGSGPTMWQGYLVGPDRTWAVVTSPVANYSRGRGLVRALRQAAQRARALAAEGQQLGPQGAVAPCVVLLRRRADEGARRAVPGILVVDVEGLAAAVAGAGAAGPFGTEASSLL
ncbi:MAG TPA: hypothetical protein VKZ69_10665 [Limnochordales bacterium]|nr:hypothetical protein [Limnochordales bacterium]